MARASSLQQFTKKFRVMLASGFPLVEALEVAAEDSDRRWTGAVRQVAKDISRGMSLSRALGRWPDDFPGYYVGSIASAEVSGQLVRTLDFLELWLDREAELRAKLQKAMFYPCTVLLFSLVMVLVLFNSVVPKLMTSFSSSLYEQALPTKILMGMTTVLSHPVFYLFLGLVVIESILIWRDRLKREKLLGWIYATPLVGGVLGNIAALRYVSALTLLLDSGGSMLPSLKAAANSSGSPLLVRDAERVMKGITDGDSLSELWSSFASLYPSIIVQMAIVGETSSSFSDALGRTLPYLEMDSHQRLERFTEIVEPVLISGVALFIGFVAVSVVLPISQMTAHL